MYSQNVKFLSENARLRALIFGMWHHLVGLYQFFQIMSLGPNIALPSQGAYVLIGLYRQNVKNLLA